MSKKTIVQESDSPVEKLIKIIQEAIILTKKARRNRKNLSGDNYYADKLSECRANATNLYREFVPVSAGDSSALAEMLQIVFAYNTETKKRVETAREIILSLRTTWQASKAIRLEERCLVPMSIFNESGRGYLVTIARQMNECYSHGCPDASVVMMRRLLEIVIIEAFEAKKIASKIKDSKDNYLQLSDLVGHALKENSWTLSRNCKHWLPILKDAGHNSAHGRYYTARSEDIEKLQPGCRIVIEEFLHHAGLI